MCPDFLLDTAVHRIVISQRLGRTMGVDHTPLGDLFGYSTELDGVIGPNKQFANMREMLDLANKRTKYLDERFVFYVDKEAFVRLGVDFFRALLPNSTAGSIYQILKSYQVFHRLEARSHNRDVVGYYNIAEALEFLTLTRQQVEKAYNESEINPNEYTQFFNEELSGMNLEFTLSTYRATGDMQSHFARIGRNFMAEVLFNVLGEIKGYISGHMTERNIRTGLGLPAEFNIDTIEEDHIGRRSLCRPLFAGEIWERLTGNHAVKMFNLMDSVSPADFQTLLDLLKRIDFRVTHMLPRRDSIFLWKYFNRLPEADWTPYAPELLEDLIRLNNEETLDARSMMWSFGHDYHGLLNMYLLQYLFDCCRNDVPTLNQYVINGSTGVA